MPPSGAGAGPGASRAGGPAVTLSDGRTMPALGLGVYKSPPGPTTEKAVATALEVGYRHIDTAKLYANEEDVGRAVRASGIPRREIFVTTKVWNDDQGYESTLKAFAASERRLGLEYIDLYLVHWPVQGTRLDTWRALQRLRTEGRCRSIGVSNFTPRHLEELRGAGGAPPVVNQVEMSPFLAQPELRRYCREHAIQVEAYAPLTRGQRLDDATLARVAQAHGATPPQVAIRWALDRGLVVIPKSVRPERIRENFHALELRLTPEDLAALDALDVGFRTSWDPNEMP